MTTYDIREIVHQPRLAFLTSRMTGRRPRKEHLLPALVRANGCWTQTKLVCVMMNTSQGEASAERYSMGTRLPSCLILTRGRETQGLEAPEEEVLLKRTIGSRNRDPGFVARQQAKRRPPVAAPPRHHPMSLGRPRHKMRFGEMNSLRDGDDVFGFGRYGPVHSQRST